MECLAISGGVGGAKLALGLSHVLSASQLGIVANTGDDFEHLGLKICPDLDTVMYTLGDLSNKELGWGQAGETWNFLEALEQFEAATWFRLGDRDLATHICRTEMLKAGASLSAVTEHLCRSIGITHAIFPMCDSNVPTKVHVDSGEVLAFQHYFVRDRCQPVVTGFEFDGIESAVASPRLSAALDDPELNAIVICPSNPFVSVDPVLKIPGVMQRMKNHPAPIVAISPIVGGEAIKGPAAKMMQELGMPTSALTVAEHYVGRIDGLIIDSLDETQAESIRALGIQCLVTNTIMSSLSDRIELAKTCLAFAAKLKTQSRSW